MALGKKFATKKVTYINSIMYYSSFVDFCFVGTSNNLSMEDIFEIGDKENNNTVSLPYEESQIFSYISLSCVIKNFSKIKGQLLMSP